MIHRSHIAALTLLLASSIHAAEFAGGAGTAADPYQIATAEQLISIGDGAALLNKYFALVDDIDLDPNLPGGQIFTRAVIAYDEDPYHGVGVAYTGRFYGHGHAIRHLTIESAGLQRVGLFGRIGSAGRVYDLILEDVRVSAPDHAGGLAGLNEGGLTNCSVSGRIEAPGQGSWLGGLVGINAGTLLNCRADVTLTAGDKGLMLGLLVGMHSGGMAGCAATGELSSGSASLDLGALAGGCVGGAIRDSHASGRIVAGDGSWALGGLAGRADSGTVVANSYANVAIAVDAGGHDLGGLIGTCIGTEAANCCASGDVRGGQASYNVGGLLGSCLGAAVRNACATGTVFGFRRLGGFVGYAQTGTSIVHCLATGRVLRGDQPWGRGGFVGYVDRSSDVRVTGCFWDVERSGASVSAAGRGLTTLQMRDQHTFQTAKWDMAGESADGTADLWLVPEGGERPVLATLSDQYQPTVLKGTGTSGDPYQIATPEDLGAMARYSPSAWYRLVGDIDLSGVTWSAAPVANFAGGFDGRGHRIRHLTLQGDASARTGLFGRIESGAWVFDLGLEDVMIDLSSDSVAAGGLAGENAGQVLGCYVTGAIAVGADCRNAGGLIGTNWLGVVEDCYTVVDVRAGTDARQIGGLLGLNYMGSVTNCYAAGKVSGDAVESLGALAGHSSEHAAAKSCYYLASATGGGPDRGEGVAVTADQMTRQTTFVDWDFKNTWTLCEGKGSPRLRWEEIACDK